MNKSEFRAAACRGALRWPLPPWGQRSGAISNWLARQEERKKAFTASPKNARLGRLAKDCKESGQ